VHEEVAVQGQTEAPEADADVDYHFIAFVPIDGNVYELDGVKPFPINHGPTTDETFIKDAAKVIRDKFVAHASELAGGFSVLALGPAASDDE
jgi:ubiquitin carboxyl-terminal hydrolase L3